MAGCELADNDVDSRRATGARGSYARRATTLRFACGLRPTAIAETRHGRVPYGHTMTEGTAQRLVARCEVAAATDAR